MTDITEKHQNLQLGDTFTYIKDQQKSSLVPYSE